MKLRFYQWMGVSLLLHVVAVSPFTLPVFRTQALRYDNRLDLELFGIVSDRQQEEKRKAGNPASPAPPVVMKKGEPARPARGAPPAMEEAMLPAPEPLLMESPVLEQPAFEQKDLEKSLLALVGSMGTGEGGRNTVFVSRSTEVSSGGSGGTDDVNLVAISLGLHHGKVDRIGAYTAMVARRLQENLIYPKEIRKKGVEGLVTIVFTITEEGTIKGNRVRVRTSSGYTSLDNGAMESARASEPFAKPPKELTLAIEVSFEMKSKKGG